MFVRSALNYDVKAASREAALSFDPLTDRAKQSFKEECDVNVLVKRFGITGQMKGLSRVPLEGDFTGVVDFHSAATAVREAEELFMEVPAYLRKRFGHDPSELFAFLANDKNREEAVKLGLIPKPVEKTRDVVQAVDELAAKIVSRETK